MMKLDRAEREQVANTIFNQLGGHAFCVMTGAKNFLILDSGLRMSLGRNASKANRLEIEYTALDDYTMRFYRYTAGRVTKSGKWIDDKCTEIATYEHVYADQLIPLFEDTTKMYTRLF